MSGVHLLYNIGGRGSRVGGDSSLFPVDVNQRVLLADRKLFQNIEMGVIVIIRLTFIVVI